MTSVSVVRIRDNLADALNQVACHGEGIVLERRGKGAVLISMEDLAPLDREGGAEGSGGNEARGATRGFRWRS